jgi:hypothetical protein
VRSAAEPAPLVRVALADVAVPSPEPAAPEPVEGYRGVAALRAVVTEKVAAPVPAAPRSAPVARPAPPAASGLEGETAFAAWAPRTAGDKALLDTLPAAPAARSVRRVLNAGIKAEGPVHVDRLVRLAAGAFGLGRVTESRRAALLAVLPPAALDGDWLWPAGLDRDSWTGFRRQAASADRPLEHVAPEEIGNAMAALCRAGGGADREDLLTQTAQVFGYRRRTPTLTPLLEAALERALATGRLTERPDGLLTA